MLLYLTGFFDGGEGFVYDLLPGLVHVRTHSLQQINHRSELAFEVSGEPYAYNRLSFFIFAAAKTAPSKRRAAG